MRKLFTLLVGAMFAGSAFGQAKWTTIYQQDLENNFEDPNMEFFQSRDWRDGSETQVTSTALVVEDPADPTNHCVKIVVRSEAEADAAGNKSTEWNGNFIGWDTQFFIVLKDAVPAGKEIRLTLKIKGEKASQLVTQYHSDPGSYIGEGPFDPKQIEYTTEWDTYKRQAEVTEKISTEEKPYKSIAFNLTVSPFEGNVVYLDDIKVDIRDIKTDDSDASWINFMRKGVFSEDPIDEVNYGSDSIPNMVKVSNFMIQVRDPETGQNILKKADIVETGDAQFPNAVKVPTLNHYTETVEEPEVDAETGEPVLDDDGNPVIKTTTTYYWEDGQKIGTSAPDRYASQFFVSTLHKMKSGEKYKFVFWVKADKPASIATQAHTLPTKYKDFNTFKWVDTDGSEKTEFPVTTEWTRYELGEAAGQTIPSGASGCQTITFDTYLLQEANNYYFVFEECSFTEKNVTIEDRTLGTPENLLVPINTDDNDKAFELDATTMLQTYELEDFSFLKNPKEGDGIKLYNKIEPEDEGDDPTYNFGAMLGWNDGGFINGEGFFIEDDSDQGINIRFDEESVNGNKVNLVVWNNPDSGISFADGKTVQTKLAISNAGWYYIYNITLGTEETLAGIAPVKTVKAGNGLIYNLAGQRVDASYKGLVIKNGQKMIQK